MTLWPGREELSGIVGGAGITAGRTVLSRDSCCSGAKLVDDVRVFVVTESVSGITFLACFDIVTKDDCVVRDFCACY